MSDGTRISWGTVAASAAAALAVSLGSLYLAHATAGGETRRALSFAGTLHGATGLQTLTFTFHKGAATICAPTAMTTPDANGAFNVEIPIDTCPVSLFDGSDVTFDVSVGTTVVAMGQAVNPVPYARYADKVGTPDCPVGYERDASASGIVLCRKGVDEIVRVGTGASAFWIDRYEASVWTNPDGTGTRYGWGVSDYPPTFPNTGQWTTPLYAVSRVAVAPSVYIKWFQALEACAASGKRLPTGSEWIRAAHGTADPGASAGNGGLCLTSATNSRLTGAGTLCVSSWGAQDMIGNVAEWTDEWFAGIGNGTGIQNPWPPEYQGDVTINVSSAAFNAGGATAASGVPSGAVRGGYFNDGTGAGIFQLRVDGSPANQANVIGFRCVVPR